MRDVERIVEYIVDKVKNAGERFCDEPGTLKRWEITFESEVYTLSNG